MRAPRSQRPVLVGAVDLGGTKVLAGVFRAEGGSPRAPASPGRVDGVWRPIVRRRIDTLVEQGPAVIIDRMAALLEELTLEAVEAGEADKAGGRPGGHPAGSGPSGLAGSGPTGLAGSGPTGLAAVGVASPGPLDSRTGVVIHAPNLFWHDVPLAAELAGRLGVPVFVDNDANLAALAEWSVRAAGSEAELRRRAPGDPCRSFSPDPLLYVTVSTGIGAGIINRGEIFHGFRDAAGEVGHMTVVPGEDAPACNCGNRGCLESVASGTALARRARERFGEGTTPADLEGLFAAGDPAATAVVTETARWLGLGLASAAAILDPEVIVVGGGVSHLGLPFLDLVRAEMALHLMPGTWAGKVPALELARLGDDAALVGAAILARRRMEALE